MEHVVKDNIVTPGMVRDRELELNNHARQWVRICKIGENQGQVDFEFQHNSTTN